MNSSLIKKKKIKMKIEISSLYLSDINAYIKEQIYNLNTVCFGSKECYIINVLSIETINFLGLSCELETGNLIFYVCFIAECISPKKKKKFKCIIYKNDENLCCSIDKCVHVLILHENINSEKIKKIKKIKKNDIVTVEILDFEFKTEENYVNIVAKLII